MSEVDDIDALEDAMATRPKIQRAVQMIQARAENAERAGVVAFEAQLVAERQRDEALATIKRLSLAANLSADEATEQAERECDEARAGLTECREAMKRMEPQLDAALTGLKEITATRKRIEALVEQWRAEPWDTATDYYKKLADELEVVLEK